MERRPGSWATAMVILLALVHALDADGACPFHHGAGKKHGAGSVPRLPKQEPFDPAAVENLDWEAVKADLRDLMTDSRPQWPADFEDGPTGPSYSGLFIRQAWHCAGSYRSWDGRGGCEGGHQRFYPEESWPDNTNLDKSRALLAPIKAKYGAGLSWGDLTILAGNVALEASGFKTLGFCAGRIDDTDGTASLPLGPTPEQRAIAPCKAGDGNCEQPLGQTTMGLIYVNPEGVLGNPVPVNSVPHIRGTFGRMSMNDTETVALIGGGHALGKTHGACPTGAGPSPAEAPEDPWPGTCGEGAGKGKGKNAFTAGFEGSWTTTPTRWSNEFFHNLLAYDWEKEKSPGGHWQWAPKAKAGSSKGDLPGIRMLTTDVALLHDPEYRAAVEAFAADARAFDEAFRAAWYKLTTRDQGPFARCLGPYVPPVQPFQHPLPPPPSKPADFDEVRADIAAALTKPHPAIEPDADGDGPATYAALFATLAWQCAATFRQTDYNGGCNGARIRLSPQKDWPVNRGIAEALKVLEPVKTKHGDGLTYADLIVLAGTTALEAAAGEGKAALSLPFCPGRSDATDAEGTDDLAPRAYANASVGVPDSFVVQGLTPEEGVALAGRPRSAAYAKLQGYSGTWGGRPGALDNSFFTTLLGEEWVPSKSAAGRPEFKARGKEGVFATPEDLAVREVPALAAIARRYADDGNAWLAAFSAAWTKAMNADRIDGPASNECDDRPAPSVAVS